MSPEPNNTLPAAQPAIKDPLAGLPRLRGFNIASRFVVKGDIRNPDREKMRYGRRGPAGFQLAIISIMHVYL
jgi:hypothetical protein